MFTLVGDIMNFENVIQFLRNGESKEESKEESKNELEAVLFLYIKDRNETPEIRYIRLTDEAIKVIRESYLGKITKYSEGKNFEEFDPEEFDPHAILYSDLETIPSDDFKINELLKKKPKDIKRENEILKQNEVNKIKYILMRFRNSDGETLGIFSEYNEKNYFKPSKRLKFLFKGDSLFPIVRQDFFGLNVDIGLLFFGPKVYMLKRKLFIEVFNYTATYEKNAEEVFYYLKNENKDYKIRNIDQLRDEIHKKYKFEYYTKLNNIQINGYYKNVSFSQIKEIRTSHNLKFSIDEENKEITFSDPEEFVRLYNRDYITDDIGKEKWVAFRKKKS